MPTEEWRPIPDLDGYEASTLGRIRSVDQVLVNSAGTRRKWKGRIRACAPNPDGYRHLVIRQQSHKAATLIARTFLGPRPDGLVVRHRNGDNGDDRVVNLRYGTQSRNILDSVEHGTHRNTRKTHCPQGHPYSEENTTITLWRGNRVCRTCKRDRAAAYRRSKLPM